MVIRPSDFLLSEDLVEEKEDFEEYDDRLTSFGLGFLTGVAACCCEWLLPIWLIAIRIGIDILFRLLAIEETLQRCQVAIVQRLLVVVLLGLASVALGYQMPSRLRFLVYDSVFGCLLCGMGRATLAYLEQAGPGRRHVRSITAFWHRLLGRSLVLLVLLHKEVIIHHLFLLYVDRFVSSLITCLCICAGAVLLFQMSYRTNLWRYNFISEAFSDLVCQLDAIAYCKFRDYKLKSIRAKGKQYILEGCEDYIYEPIPSDCMRLLVLRRTRLFGYESVQGRLICTPRSLAPDYEALSYCWGDGTMSEEIFLDGRRLKITRSAFEFLASYSSVFKETCIWIDAICINQKDTIEKSEQVSQMPDIYKRATRTIAYLKDDFEARSCTTVLFECLSLHCLGDWVPYYFHNIMTRRLRTRWRAMAWLVKNPYFRRAWIMQEVALSPILTFSIAGRLVHSKVVYRALTAMASYHVSSSLLANLDLDLSKQLRAFSSGAADAVNTFALRPDTDVAFDPMQLEGRSRLGSLPFVLASLDASDPRDKVYAALGLANDLHETDMLKPDYTKAAAIVMRDATKYLLIHQPRPSLEILAFAGTGYSGRAAGRPSWTMDPDEKHRPLMSLTYVWSATSAFAASGDTVAELSLSSEDEALSIRGLLCDTLLRKSDAHFPGMTRSEKADLQDTTEFTKAKLRYMESVLHLLSQNLIDLSADTTLTRIAYAFMGSPKELNSDVVTEQDVWTKNSMLHYFDRLRASVEGETDMATMVQTQASPFRSTEAQRDSLDKPVRGMYEFAARFFAVCGGRSFGLTHAGRFVLVPPMSRQGDRVFIPFGAQTPFLVRPLHMAGESPRYELVGEAYVQGVMLGEAIRDHPKDEVITLI